MIEIIVKGDEFFDESTMTFIYTEDKTYQFEHSLYAVSEWEAKYRKPFFGKEPMTFEERKDYYRMMSLTPINIDEITPYIIDKLDEYVSSNHTATTIQRNDSGGPKTVQTSEVIYAMMVDAGVSFDCDRWNLSRLLTLLGVISARQNPKKMNVNDIYKQNTDLNEQRKKMYNTKG